MPAWNLIPAFFNTLGENISESEKARLAGQNLSDGNQIDGLVYQQSAPMDQSNFQSGSPATVGANLMGDFAGVGKQLFGKAIQGEKDLYSPNLQTQGAASDADPWSRIYMMYGRG